MRKFKKYLFFLLFLICPAFALAEQIDINTATLSQLDKLTGIGPTYAQRIIDNRPYNSIDDLLRVKGIGTTTLQKIKVQGFACVNCQELTASTSMESTTTTKNNKTNNPSTSSGQATTSQAVKPSPLPKNYPSNIFLNEVLPSPEGSDTENEFVEIFNANNFTADISGFKIKDKIGAIKTYTLPENTKILANSYLALKSSQTKISLNNAGDGVELLDPSGKIIDSTDFGKSQPGQSWSKGESNWQWTAKPTPGQANVIVVIQATSTLNSSRQTTSSPLTANIQSYSPQRKNFLAVGIATVIALSSALIAWRIKKNSTEV
ncbi:MAG: lamin tail domain-containing protein [bacterium]